VVRSTR